MNIISLWQFLKWFAIVSIVYAIVQYGVSLEIICILLLVRFLLRLFFKFIGGVIKIAAVLVILWFLTLIF